MTTLADLKDTLENLKEEYHQVIAGENPDRMEEFVRKSLNAYHEDMMYAKRNRVLTKEQFQYFNRAYCTVADKIQDAKRELKRKDDLTKNKRSLGSLHKLTLPELRDSLDGGPWVQQVDHMTRALEEQEHQDPLIKQQVLSMIKASLKTSSGQLKILKKTVENWNELEGVVEKIKDLL